MQNNELKKYLAGKSVAIVGGADKWNRREAEKRDFVIRTNANWKRQGGRMDMIYTREAEPVKEYDSCIALGVDIEADTDTWIRLARRTGAFLVYFDCQRHQRTPYHYLEWANEFNWQLDTLPFTGIVAVRHLLRLVQPEQLYLTGFSFYAKGGVIPRDVSSHHLPPQVDYLANVIGSGVGADKELKALLTNPVYAKGE